MTGVGLIGATISGGLALTNTLSDYPAPFIQDGVFNGIITVGKDAMASDTVGQSQLIADLQTKAIRTESLGVEVEGQEKEIKLGDNLNSEFDSEMNYGDLPDFLTKKTLNWKGKSYKTEEHLLLKDGLKLATSLTSDSKYEDEIYLEADRRSLVYEYEFKDEIDFEDASTSSPIIIDFLGKEINIVDRDGEKITVNFGNKYVLEQGETIEITSDGETKKVKVRAVGTNSITLDVDGVSEIISKGISKDINGLEVYLNAIVDVGNDQTAKDSVEIYLGEDVTKTIKDGDDYNEDFVWDLDDVDLNKPILRLELDSDFDKKERGAITIGDCYRFPDDFLEICFTGLTNDEYENYELKFEKSYDLSDIAGYSSDANVFVLKTDKDEGLLVDSEKTDEMVLYINKTKLDVFYYDEDDNEIKLATSLGENTTHTDFARITNEDSIFKLDITVPEYLNSTNPLTLALNEDEDLAIKLGKSSTEFTKLGDLSGESESDELKYGANGIGDKNHDIRTKYGNIIENTESNGDNDEIVMKIAEDRVKGKISIGKELESKSRKIVGVNPISPSQIKLAEEVTEPRSQNIIVIGGSAVNPLAREIFGLEREDFTPYEAIVKLVDNGDYVAMLVAGYSAIDTRNAVLSIIEGKVDLNKGEAKIISVTQTVGTYTVE